MKNKPDLLLPPNHHPPKLPTLYQGEDKHLGFKYTVPDVIETTKITWFTTERRYTLALTAPNATTNGYTPEQKEKLIGQILSTFKFTE